MNGKNNQSSASKETKNSITNPVLYTYVQRCHFKSESENIAEIVSDRKPIEVNSNNETNIYSEDKKKEEKISFHPLRNSIGFNSNSKSFTENCKDILSSLHKCERRKSNSLSSGSGSIPKCLLLKSDALQNERELKQVKNLHSLQSIYKFAYDSDAGSKSPSPVDPESNVPSSLTSGEILIHEADSGSDAGSKSPSPLDPESNVPSSLTSGEILIHEADSGSDAGSEDVELLPHRYESETFLSESKHMYVNKLSLAVELLRTQETLPYDDEFKRVTNNLMDSHSTSQSQVKCSSDSRKEALQEDSEMERRGNRNFGVHQYISPKRALRMDPWICCLIM